MAGTNLSFSLLAIRGLRKFGITINYEDQQAFMHLWNVIGYLLGLDERLLPETGKEALILEEIISNRNFKSSVHGQALTRSLVKYFSSVDANFPEKETMKLMRYLLGNKIADLLALPPESATRSTVGFLKLLNNLQLAGKTNSRFAYQQQRFAYKKALPAPIVKKAQPYTLPVSLTS